MARVREMENKLHLHFAIAFCYRIFLLLFTIALRYCILLWQYTMAIHYGNTLWYNFSIKDELQMVALNSGPNGHYWE
jgi:hypothetical protein